MSFTCAVALAPVFTFREPTLAVSASDTACSSCGVSYLIHSEVTALQRRVAAAEAQVANWADRIARVEATEGERDSWKGEAARLEREVSSMRAAARGESDRLDAARASVRAEAADEARRFAAQAEERFRSRLEAESSRWRALQSAVLSGPGLDLAETAAGLRDELRGLRASALAATAGGIEAAAAARRSVAAYIERSIKVRAEGAVDSCAHAHTSAGHSFVSAVLCRPCTAPCKRTLQEPLRRLQRCSRAARSWRDTSPLRQLRLQTQPWKRAGSGHRSKRCRYPLRQKGHVSNANHCPPSTTLCRRVWKETELKRMLTHNQVAPASSGCK